MTDVRALGAADAAALDAFLRRHTDSSMFLRSNARAAGLDYHGRPLEADYVGAFEHGALGDVAAHCWNGVMLVQAPSHVAEVARAALARSRRALRGLAGPRGQVDAACAALGVTGRPAHKNGREGLFALDLARLVVPAPLADGTVRCRRAHDAERDLLVRWRIAFMAEALGMDADDRGVAAEARADVTGAHSRDADWVLEADGRPVACAVFNAALPDAVQIGGVWTPPDLRNRGHSRAVVAGALLAARAAGVTRGVLFAEDPAAIRSYQAIGFRRIGEYGLVLFAEPA